MAIKKVINGKLVTVVEDGITNHNDLHGREEYGCHPISAIKKLPGKLFELRESINTLAAEMNKKITAAENITRNILQNTEHLDSEFAATNEIISNLSNSINKIKLEVNGSNVTFTDSNNQSQTFRVGSDVDDDTIKVDNGLIALKNVYTNANEFSGKGTKTEPIALKCHEDNDTIVLENNKYVAKAIKDDNGNKFTYQDIANQNTQNANKFTSIDNQFSQLAADNANQLNTINQKFAHQIEVDTKQQNDINNLFARTRSSGGFLNAYNFGKNVTQEQLTNYAIQDTQVQNASEIFDGTKVKNLYDNHIWILTNTPDSNPAVFSWQDIGADAAIVDANNNGLHGLVTGSIEHLEGYIDLLGHISINGLQEELDLIKGNISNLVNNLQTLSTNVTSDIQNASNTLSVSINTLASRVDAIETTLTRKADVDANGNLIVNGNSITIDDATITYNSTTQTWEI